MAGDAVKVAIRQRLVQVDEDVIEKEDVIELEVIGTELLVEVGVVAQRALEVITNLITLP